MFIFDLIDSKPLDEPLNREELQVLGFLNEFGQPKPGGFTNALIEAMFHADPMNAEKLKLSFPELMTAVLDYKLGNLHDRAKFYFAGIKHDLD